MRHIKQHAEKYATNFNPRTACERCDLFMLAVFGSDVISIHAPPVSDATYAPPATKTIPVISIHAPPVSDATKSDAWVD